jgi:hypothetical protein
MSLARVMTHYTAPKPPPLVAKQVNATVS